MWIERSGQNRGNTCDEQPCRICNSRDGSSKEEEKDGASKEEEEGGAPKEERNRKWKEKILGCEKGGAKGSARNANRAASVSAPEKTKQSLYCFSKLFIYV